LFSAAALSSLPGAAIAGNDHVGWGFEKTGGFPSNPWQHDYAMNRSTAAYFVGNASGALARQSCLSPPPPPATLPCLLTAGCLPDLCAS
jgi:hypothetical protein